MPETKNPIDDPKSERNREKKSATKIQSYSTKVIQFFLSISLITMPTNKSTTSELFYLLIACILSCPGFRALERHW